MFQTFIVIPSVNKFGNSIPSHIAEQVDREVRHFFIGEFNGFTVSPSVGVFRHEDGRISEEVVEVVTSFHEKEVSVPDMVDLAQWVKSQTLQESVLFGANIKIDGTILFV